MPTRNLVLTTNEVYHVFNRSVGKTNIFSSKYHLRKVIEIIKFYQFPQKLRLSKFKALSKSLKNDYLLALKNETPLIRVSAFAFMPNHYHLLVKQICNNGITRFISNFQNSFAKFFNLKYNRHGSLFQNPFRAKRVETEEEFIHISRYIHLNPTTAYLIQFKDLATYPWTSFSLYVDKAQNELINTEVLQGMFRLKESYVQFVSDQVDYQRKLEFIKNLIIE